MSGPVPTSYTLPRLIVIMVRLSLFFASTSSFGLAVWILPQKFHIWSVKKFIFPTILVVFVLATINIFYDLVGEAYAIMYTIPLHERPWMIAGQHFFVQFFRVYAVWGRKKLILLPLFLIILVTKLIGLFAIICNVLALDNPQKYSVVNGVIVDEIKRTYRGSKFTWYNRTLAVVTESGVIYPLLFILELSFNFPNWSCLGTIASGLAPTLVAVRVDTTDLTSGTV
ncbi:hypothetical protein BDP27DRAFT_1333372 [Rhodocollybia butyracea]|uniref:Uncharacterized protein n=1 Tax=Rhodocollybia butyracea TaxID=206335 RepID=A0A9P5PJI3_9AGAR|nr:hypothetical protein BDP27DRAFT_1333372 [Rhodocollybia butyracea]